MKSDSKTFNGYFKTLTGYPPFPWQFALFERFVVGDIPATCDLPTGLGKTNVIAVWLIAWLLYPKKMPRRLVYVVNRRTVVDQTTNEVEKLRENIKHLPGISDDAKNLAISTLRGKFADNREWSADPSRPAVICGTVDMIGSRLLFRGYGVGYKGKPLHAGFLGQDVLLVHDEAHLEPAFQTLLDDLESEQQRCVYEKGKFRVMELSATARNKPGNEQHLQPFGLSDADREHPEVARRIRAVKKLVLAPQSTTKVGEQLSTTAIDQFRDSGRPILIFVRLTEDLKLVLDRLRKAAFDPCQLSGTMRGWEREMLLRDPRFVRFLPESNRPKDIQPADGTVFLVCTSAGEVGVNISADHLICDLSTFESMAQRFGRVNRFGLHSDAEIHVIHPKLGDFEDKAPDPQRKQTLELLQQLNGDASPDSLCQLPANERDSAFAPKPTILPTTDILFDAWSLTSIRDRMPGRPSIEPYLHGIRDWEPAETQVAWREEVGVIVGELRVDYPPADLLDEYPLKPHELLRDRTDRVWRELVQLASQFPSSPIWIVNDQGKIEPQILEKLTTIDKKQAEAQLGGKTVLLPHDIGGLTAEGTLDGSCTPQPMHGKPIETLNNDVSDKLTNIAGMPLRIRLWKGGGEEDRDFNTKSNGMRHILCIDVPPTEDDEDAIKRTWHWFELPIPKDNSKNAVQPILLDGHVTDVEIKANQILANLSFDPHESQDTKIKYAILLAAKYHDLGKRREVWQRSIGRPMQYAAHWFGKSGRTWKPRTITEYRHEFGSLVDLQSVAEFQTLDENTKELVQHLIAAHHGQARPHFAAVQAIDPGSTTAICELLCRDVPGRFARLQRKYGRWGLAYMESILRAADWAASAKPDPSGCFSEDAQ